MTDRELLEMAAKAAGINKPDRMSGAVQDDGSIIFYLDCEGRTWRSWNPLKDDGDALKLAVKLQLSICNEHVSAGVAYCTREEGEKFEEEMSDEADADIVVEADYVATRRAIVKAAASIGRAMK